MSEYWNVMVPELTVTDFEGSLSFYTDILGFKIRNQRENPNFAYLEDFVARKIQVKANRLNSPDLYRFLDFERIRLCESTKFVE